MNTSISVFIAICLLYVSVRVFADEVVIVDKKGVKVELIKMETKEINYQSGNIQSTIRVATIANIHLAEDGEMLILKTVKGKELKGTSSSKVEGIWELGKYEVSLSDVKSVDFRKVIEPQQAATEVNQPNGVLAKVTDRVGVTMEVADFHYNFDYSYPTPGWYGKRTYIRDNPRSFLPFEYKEITIGIPFSDIDAINFTDNEQGVRVKRHDGSSLSGSLGEYGDFNERFTGKSEFGDFSLSATEVRQVIIKRQGDKNTRNIGLSKDIQGDLASGYTISIKTWHDNQFMLLGGYVFNLRNGYEWTDLKTSFYIKVGESSNIVEFSKIKSIRFQDKDKLEAMMTTVSGKTLEVSVYGDMVGGNVDKLGPGRISIDKVATFEIVKE